MKFKAIPQAIKEVLVIETHSFGDDRGFFVEVFRSSFFEKLGLPRFVQDNHSRSSRGVLRGLHYQNNPHPLGKLVRCARGAIFDVAVDIRRGSPTYAKWVGVTLSDDDHNMLWVPPGFAHGFYTITETADVLYKCTDYYHPELDRSVAWNDPHIAVVWPAQNPNLSGKDTEAPRLKDSDNNLVYGLKAGE